MKKTLLAIALLSAINISNISISHARDSASGASAELSLMSGLVILSATVAPLMFFDELSRNNQALVVENVENENGKSKVKLSSGQEKIELQVDKKTTDKLNVQPGKEVKVQKNSLGYTLNVDNKVLGVVSNTNEFKSNKIN